ncbi:alpha/beta hydrolase family protein [Salsipaludibacter albus]|uniref:alpha/beta hydrolase family protein n=1 Tax=Salsipaludibacter albus TaxID=2849650 RepID=UPI001EE40175|nr:alpha/beta hydrolase [Salsipaludibacter albus]MBY5160967.1 alpha/beta hydrolase [Salsipaludibacter albus]
MTSTPDTVRRITYGTAPDQVADLRLPTGVQGLAPVAIVVHGGFWRAHRTLEMVAPLAEDLTARGWATWNLEYGRVGGRGGWPTTLTDVAAGVDALAEVAAEEPLDLDRVVAIGHSAGGHLALWTAARPHLPDGAPGARPTVVPAAVVSLAGVADLRAAADDSLGEGAAVEFLGGTPDEVGDRYDVASPAEHLPLGVPQLLAHGDADQHVPLRHARAHRDAARAAGDDVTLLEFSGADHFPVIEPDSAVWQDIVAQFPEV